MTDAPGRDAPRQDAPERATPPRAAPRRAAPQGAADVVVVGGGAIGLSSAWRCAQRGLDVVVCDPVPGRGASWAAAGMLAPVTELHYGETDLLRLNLASNGRWPAFAAELAEATGHDLGYRETGTLSVARDADDLAAMKDVAAFQRSLGLEVEELRGRECRRLEPALAPSVRGGVLAAGDHQVDNRALVGALVEAVGRAGVRVHRRAVTEVTRAGDRVTGVVDDAGERLGAATVVLAAGWASASVGGLPPAVRPPVRPVKGQLLHLRARPPGGWAGGTRGRSAAGAAAAVAGRTLRGLDAYLVPRGDGRLVVGATVEEVGDDLEPTAGGVFELLRAAWELLPGVLDMAFEEVATGLRPGSPDNAPLLGRGALDGLLVATGHYRNGVLLTPVTSETVAALVAGDEPPPEAAAFSPLRFADA